MGGSKIGGVWHPNLKSARPFRVLGGYSSLPINKVCSSHNYDAGAHSIGQDDGKNKEKDKGLVILNQQALSVEVRRIGSGLITSMLSQVG